jgi:chromosome partitioning protein
MRVITFLNHKGGVGKTTLSCNAAGGLSARGYRVLMIDTDAQAHATLLMGSDPGPGLYDLLVRRAPWQNILQVVTPEHYGPQVAGGALFLVPSNFETVSIANHLQDPSGLRRRLQELARVRDGNGKPIVDIVVIDASPTPSFLHTIVYLATDAIVYPTKLEWLSMVGVQDSIAILNNIQDQVVTQGRKPIEIMGILPNLRRATVLHEENLKRAREAFQYPIWRSVGLRTAWSDATDMGELLVAWRPTKDSAVAIREAWSIVDEIEKRLKAWENDSN